MSDIEKRRRAVERLLPRAGGLALSYFRNPGLKIDYKSAQDLVTQADVQVERLIRTSLLGAFPDDAFIGEEGGNTGRIEGGDFVWVVDPIDGTANFARGIPHWCISIALLRAGKVELGFIHDPLNRESFAARLGEGASLNGRKIEVSDVAELARARVGAGFSYRRPPDLHLRGVALLLENGCEYSRFASGALGMAWTACGRFDAYWEPHINSWDVLAGVAIAKEAGARVNDFLEGRGLLEGNPILACAPGIEGDLRRLLDPLNEEAKLMSSQTSSA